MSVELKPQPCQRAAIITMVQDINSKLRTAFIITDGMLTKNLKIFINYWDEFYQKLPYCCCVFVAQISQPSRPSWHTGTTCSFKPPLRSMKSARTASVAVKKSFLCRKSSGKFLYFPAFGVRYFGNHWLQGYRNFRTVTSLWVGFTWIGLFMSLEMSHHLY